MTALPTALQLNYRPRDPQRLDQPIGLIGCGGITSHHLTAYRAAGYPVVALCDVDLARAEARRKEFYPQAVVYRDYRELLRDSRIRVIDVATHPVGRGEIIAAAIRAGKHVLSQKPFVLDLDEGEQLVELAAAHGVQLAVNQNGRWAPHFSYALAAAQAGLLGRIASVNLAVHWDHSWVAGTEFEKVRHLILYDYAIHGFDFVQTLLAPRRALRVYAATSPSPSQTIMPRLQGQAIIEYEDVQVTLSFAGHTRFHPENQMFITGTDGTLISRGPSDREQSVQLTLATGNYHPPLLGSWFPDGFHGTMGELLRGIESGESPAIDARRNLASLALCFAAVASAESHQPVAPGEVRRLPE